MHLNRRQFGQQVRRVGEADPVILDILPRGEMAVAPVIFPGDVRQHPHLPPVKRAIGDGDAQHIGVQLQIEAVHQPQRLELILGQFARHPALGLVAEFIDAGVNDGLVNPVVTIHVKSPTGRRHYPGTRPNPA